MSPTTPPTLVAALAGACQRWPDQVALCCEGTTLTYAELGRAIEQLAQTYRRWGIGRGDRVVCALTNRPEHVVAMGAAWLSGAIHAGVDHQSTAHELSVVLEQTRAKAILCEQTGRDGAATTAFLRARHPNLVIGMAPDAPSGPIAFSGPASPVECAGAPDPPLPSDPAIIFLSSGTTGKPKATIGYHENLSRRWRRLCEWQGFGAADVHLAQLPLAHGFGMMMALAGLLGGGRLVLLREPLTDAVVRAIESQNVTVLNGAPAHFRLILDRLGARATKAALSLRVSVGTAAAFPPELVERIWDELGVRFTYMYGSSEGVGVATSDRDDIRKGSVGRPQAGACRIVDANHEPVACGQVGEIAFSRNVYPVKYWDGEAAAGAPERPQATPNEWYYSGDLGRLDESGRLYVTGRLKQQIDRGGIKVDPVEVEAALLRWPAVADAAVIGLPDAVLGELVCACVVPRAEQPLRLEQVRAHLSQELAPYKIPEVMCLMDRLPRTQLGKIDLTTLRSRATDGAAQQRVPR